eukprot:3683107-Rhodomonas_salina.3
MLASDLAGCAIPGCGGVGSSRRELYRTLLLHALCCAAIVHTDCILLSLPRIRYLCGAQCKDQRLSSRCAHQRLGRQGLCRLTPGSDAMSGADIGVQVGKVDVNKAINGDSFAMISEYPSRCRVACSIGGMWF